MRILLKEVGFLVVFEIFTPAPKMSLVEGGKVASKS